MNPIQDETRCPPMFVFSPGLSNKSEDVISTLVIGNNLIRQYIASDSVVYRGPRHTLDAAINEVKGAVTKFLLKQLPPMVLSHTDICMMRNNSASDLLQCGLLP